MKRIFKVLSVLAGLLCVGCLVLLFQFHRTYKKSSEEYAGIANEAVRIKNIQNPTEEKAEPEEVPPLLSVDFEALQAINGEVYAWIDFPGQERSYPVVQSENNEYYLNHTFKGYENLCGSIFADCRNSGIFTDSNTVLYGHNMRNLSMFGFLRKYQEEEYYKAYPYFDIYLSESTYRCRILACCKVAADWSNFPTQFADEEERKEFIGKMMDSCAYETIAPDAENERPLVMLSTCTGRGHTYRLILLAEAYEVAEMQKAEENSGEKNE